MKNKIKNNILDTIPRLLTQLDRDPLSPTYGCFDRNYWHYKIRDFPSFVLQQNVLTLTLLYKNKFQGNFCYKNENILEYIKAAINFWCDFQHKSGGFDEYWPNEDGYPPLVFSFYAVVRSCRELNLFDKKFLDHFDLAYSRWFKHTEKQAVNQEIAGLAAVYQYFLVKKDEKVKKNFNLRLKSVLKSQNKEGWFYEYGGADIGYSSVLLHYLTDIKENNGDKKIKQSICRLCDFLCFFVHPDGTVGGEYGSRNTEYFLLKGLVSASSYSKSAFEMLKKIDWKLSNLDDRYLFHYVFCSYVEGFLDLKNNLNKNLDVELKNNNFKKYFVKSGLFLYRNKDIYFVVNLKKGGVFKLYKGKKIIYQDAGYRISSKNKKNAYLVSGWINDKTKIIFTGDNKKISLKTFFYKNKYFVSTPLKHIVLRIASFFLSSRLISILKKMLILQNSETNFIFKRDFLIDDNKLKVIDHIDLYLVHKPIYRFASGSMRYVPSSNFFNTKSIGFKIFTKSRTDKDGRIEKIINF